MAYKAIDVRAGTVDLANVDALGQTTPPKHATGTRVKCFDPVYGEGEAVYLQIPTSTAIAAGLICYASSVSVAFTGSTQQVLRAAALPAVGTSKSTGRAVYVCLNAVTSDSSNFQYTWFLRRGTTTVLKTAVKVLPDSQIYASTTAGRFYQTSSAGATIIGARSVNAATITTTTSTVLVQIDNPAIMGT